MDDEMFPHQSVDEWFDIELWFTWKKRRKLNVNDQILAHLSHSILFVPEGSSEYCASSNGFIFHPCHGHSSRSQGKYSFSMGCWAADGRLDVSSNSRYLIRQTTPSDCLPNQCHLINRFRESHSTHFFSHFSHALGRTHRSSVPWVVHSIMESVNDWTAWFRYCKYCNKNNKNWKNK